MAWFVLLVVVVAVAYRLTTPEDRQRLLQRAIVVLRELITEGRRQHADLEPFRASLRARTPIVILTPALAAANVAIFMLMLFGAGALSDPATLVSWGANYGPRTTNLEWWRLLTSPFVHSGFLRMVLDVAVIVQLGMLLERLVGRSALAAVFCSAGMLAGLVNVSADPMAVTGGPSGALFGLYGLLLASIVHRDRDNEEEDPQTVAIPRAALWWFIPAAVLFIVSSANDDFAFKANGAGFLAGLVGGFVVTYGIIEEPPALRRVLIAAGVALAAIVAYAVPLRGIADVRPEIPRIIALEDKTTSLYQAAVNRVNKGAMTPEALAQLIERTIVPELEAADAHLLAIRGVPPEHQHLVADADEYLRLRSASWRFYAEGWRGASKAPRREQPDGAVVSDASWRQTKAQFRANAARRGKAEGTERASLEALQRLKPSSE